MSTRTDLLYRLRELESRSPEHRRMEQSARRLVAAGDLAGATGVIDSLELALHAALAAGGGGGGSLSTWWEADNGSGAGGLTVAAGQSGLVRFVAGNEPWPDDLGLGVQFPTTTLVLSVGAYELVHLIGCDAGDIATAVGHLSAAWIDNTDFGGPGGQTDWSTPANAVTGWVKRRTVVLADDVTNDQNGFQLGLSNQTDQSVEFQVNAGWVTKLA